MLCRVRASRRERYGALVLALVCSYPFPPLAGGKKNRRIYEDDNINNKVIE